MRNLLWLFVVVCLCAGIAAAQQGKIASEWTCAKPSNPHSVDAGDKPGHAFVVQQVKCTASKGEINGVKEKEGTATESLDVSGDKITGHGVFLETLANGDKMTVDYQVNVMTKNGQFQSGGNTWHATEGTGKLKGVKANGHCTGKPNADGSTTFTCNGTYNIPK